MNNYVGYFVTASVKTLEHYNIEYGRAVNKQSVFMLYKEQACHRRREKA